MKIISIASGKGGVGKTTACVNLASEMVRQGKKILLLDCDLGLANVCLALGLEPEKTMEDFFFNGVSLSEVMIETAQGLKIIPGVSGSGRLAAISTAQKEELLLAACEIAADYDYLLVDTAAGISENVLFFLHASDMVIALTSAEPTAMADGYALFKILAEGGCPTPYLLLNRCRSFWDAKTTSAKIRLAVRKFLGRDVRSVGYIRDDKSVAFASRMQKAVVHEYPFSRAAFDFKRAAETVCGKERGLFTKFCDIFR